MCNQRILLRLFYKMQSRSLQKFSFNCKTNLKGVMKSLINSIDDCVVESLYGLNYAYPRFEYQASRKVVLIPKLEQRRDKVSLICGGGSGHEPFAAGFVGNGMLTGSVAGSIFAAPPSQHISYCIERVSEHNKTGILMIIPNYTGDCLNFGIAIEKARQAGLEIADIFVNDDCSIPNEEQGVAGKRGLAGMLFIMKIAGALAERGLSLEEIRKTAEIVLQNMATYAIGLTACSIPGQPPMFELAENQIECGMGVHGEAGYEKIQLKSSSETVAFMLKHICASLSLQSGDSVAGIINNFGALSQLEQGIVVHDTIKHLRTMKIKTVRLYAGLLMTSLNSAGVHITLLKLTENNKDLFVSCLDEPTDAPKWPGCLYSIPLENVESIVENKPLQRIEKVGIQIDSQLQTLLKQCLQNACNRLIEKETYINDLDRGCGDGDCGSTIKRLAVEILLHLDSFPLSHPSSVFSELAHIAEEQMGGTSGALYCLFFTTIATELTFDKRNVDWLHVWARAFRAALNCLMKYGKAKPGDRSMVDVINAVCETYENMLNKSVAEICEILKTVAWQVCESTRNMKPRVGRASYVKQAEYLRNVDAGAYGIATIVHAVSDVIKNTVL